MEVIIEKIKEYKIIVICAGLGLALSGFFLLKPSSQTPVKSRPFQRIHHLKRKSRRKKRTNRLNKI